MSNKDDDNWTIDGEWSFLDTLGHAAIVLGLIAIAIALCAILN